MVRVIWSLITSRLGGWLVAGVAVLALLTWLKLERNAKHKAQEDLATKEMAYDILNQGYLQLHEDRAQIQAEAATARRKLDELRRLQDYNGLADTWSGGVQQPGTPDTKRGSKGLTRYRDSVGAEFTD